MLYGRPDMVPRPVAEVAAEAIPCGLLAGSKVTALIAKGQLITRQNTQVPANSRIAALRTKQDAMLGYAPPAAQAVPA